MFKLIVMDNYMILCFVILKFLPENAYKIEFISIFLFYFVSFDFIWSLMQPDLGIKKILIVDWDVHHGNATQKMFWRDPRVLFFSVHR